MSKSTKPNTKVKAQTFNPNDFYHDQLKIDDELIEEMTKKGFEWRFINALDFQKKGFNKSQWTPYKRDKTEPTSSQSKIFGSDPDGFIKRGDLILAVKSSEKAQAHRAFLDQRSQQLSKAVGSYGADELKKAFRDAGVNAKVLTGYDDEE